MVRTLLSFAIVLCACGDNKPAYDLYDHRPDAFETVTVWVAPHPDVPLEVALEACEAWGPEGVRCAPVADPLEALVRIYVDEEPCERNAEGTYTLGTAFEGGTIVLGIECLRKFGGTPVSEDLLWPTIGHEVGHQLGIWIHVDPAEGVALMNPMIHEALFGITVIDHQAYLERDESRAILRLTDGGCVLTIHE